MLGERVPDLKLGDFTLDKMLPVAAGIGGGSADAAAALRLLAQANGLAFDDPRLIEAAELTGADVPVCLFGKACRMQGVGERIKPLENFAPRPAVLVNPGVAVATRDVFAGLALPRGETVNQLIPDGFDLATLRNDMTAAAIALGPVIADVLAALAALPGVAFARMSGSGATCFAIFQSADAATLAATHIARREPNWWTRAVLVQ